MKDKVGIVIEGIIEGEEENSITTKATGEYSKSNGGHIIKYKDTDNKNGESSDNIIKILPGLIEMVKLGEHNTHMIFDLSGTTHTVYNTPYGSLNFQINTSKIDIVEKPGEITVNMEYKLSHENTRISDNLIKISITDIK